MNPQFVWIALATLVSEDLTCIATGVLVAQGQIGFLEGTLACITGIAAGDTMLLLAGRLAGRQALVWPPLAKLLPPHRVEQGASWLRKRGLAVVLLSRFTPGLRLPTYFAAGLLPTNLTAFIFYFLVAAALWTPILVGAAGAFGEELLQAVFSGADRGLAAFAIVSSFLGLAYWLGKRAPRWEFWPAWVAYLPLVPYFLYLAIRHRSFTLFTAANPGIPSGGLAGESKSQILSHLSDAAEYILIPPNGLEDAQRFIDGNFPVVLKPDVGERGTGVAIIRSFSELTGYLKQASGDTIVQRYVEGSEFGVFYCRMPHEPRGRIVSITRKLFPCVVGDGRTTLRNLIRSDPRAVHLAKTYEKTSRRPIDDVPAAGESVPLVELGSHCRGAVFLDGGHLKTEAMEEAIDRIAQSHPGFFFGRFDIRTSSIKSFREGHSFKVIELNGVSAEATHVYDPAVSLVEAYRVMFQTWRTAFAIGAANRDRGAKPMHLTGLLALLIQHLQRVCACRLWRWPGNLQVRHGISLE